MLFDLRGLVLSKGHRRKTEQKLHIHNCGFTISSENPQIPIKTCVL